MLQVLIRTIRGGAGMGLRIDARYSTIRAINRVALAETNLNGFFHETCEAVKGIMPCDRMGFSLYVPERGALRLAAADGAGDASFYQVGVLLDGAATHHGWVFQHQKPLVRRDIERELQFEVEQHNVAEGIRSYCAVPLITRGKSIGVIIVLSSRRNSYSDAHAQFLQEVSDQFVLAIKSLTPACPRHAHTNLICPRCIASSGGQATVARHREQLSEWGKQGGRGRKKLTSPRIETIELEIRNKWNRKLSD